MEVTISTLRDNASRKNSGRNLILWVDYNVRKLNYYFLSFYKNSMMRYCSLIGDFYCKIVLNSVLILERFSLIKSNTEDGYPKNLVFLAEISIDSNVVKVSLSMIISRFPVFLG